MQIIVCWFLFIIFKNAHVSSLQYKKLPAGFQAFITARLTGETDIHCPYILTAHCSAPCSLVLHSPAVKLF